MASGKSIFCLRTQSTAAGGSGHLEIDEVWRHCSRSRLVGSCARYRCPPIMYCTFGCYSYSLFPYIGVPMTWGLSSLNVLALNKSRRNHEENQRTWSNARVQGVHPGFPLFPKYLARRKAPVALSGPRLTFQLIHEARISRLPFPPLRVQNFYAYDKRS